MVDPASEGKRLYQLLYKNYDFNFGGSVVGISGAQGSVKTTVCLDLVEKKLLHHPDEKIFWRETLKSPMQCERLIDSDYKIFVEEGYDVKFIKSKTSSRVYPEAYFFKDVDDLYNNSECGVLNTVFFKNRKGWTDLISRCNMDSLIWTSVFLDEMEGLFEAGSNNQTKDKWWDWMAESGHVIKECRKSHTSVIGNYHDENLIDHRVKGKFMFFLYGFGAIVNRARSRIKQGMVDACRRGEFCIALGRNRFGKIQVVNYYPSIDDCIIPYI